MIQVAFGLLVTPFAILTAWLQFINRGNTLRGELLRGGHGVALLAVTIYLSWMVGLPTVVQELRAFPRDPTSHWFFPAAYILVGFLCIGWIPIAWSRTRKASDGRLWYNAFYMALGSAAFGWWVFQDWPYWKDYFWIRDFGRIAVIWCMASALMRMLMLSRGENRDMITDVNKEMIYGDPRFVPPKEAARKLRG